MDYASILFLDIECVSGKASFNEINDSFQTLWNTKAAQLYRNDPEIPDSETSYKEKAGIFAEYGKIVCISVGIMVESDQGWQVRLKSFADHDESVLLAQFAELMNKNRRIKYLCGHNLKEFDVPYICRRYVANLMPLPRLFDVSGKKPWDLDYILDTMHMWRFGDNRAYIKLSALTALFDIPSPKDDIDGSEVGRVYWEENDLERIAVYCQKDVLAVVQVLLKYNRQALITEENVIIPND